jgi:hypothetical protein
MMGRSVLELGRVPTLEEVFSKIQDLDPKKLVDVAEDIFDVNKLSLLTLIPNNGNGNGNGKH